MDSENTNKLKHNKMLDKWEYFGYELAGCRNEFFLG